MRSYIFICAVFLFSAVTCWAQEPGQSQVLPARFSENLIWIEPVTASGDTLHLYADTGAGQSVLLGGIDRLGLAVTDTSVDGKDPTRVAKLPSFRSDASIPPTDGHGKVLEGWIRVLGVGGGRMRDESVRDGILGQDWFAGRIWTFDYRKGKLLQHASVEKSAFDPSHIVPLGFKTDSTGQRAFNFARIEAEIGGESYPFVFDTGASMQLSDPAQDMIGGGSKQAASYIEASIFETWRAEHPNWRVIKEGDRGHPRSESLTPIIEVPEVTIAGHTVGPVWFTKRSKTPGLTSYLDQPVDGMLGGSLLQHFVITVHYPDAWAAFQRER